jgi:hypothetical protein
MTVYSELTDDEQRLLRASLQAAAVAVSAASRGRDEETVSEGFAAASFILGSLDRYVGNPLVASVIVEIEARIRAEQAFPDYVAAATAVGARDQALETLRRTAALLDARATPLEAAGYKEWLSAIAQAVAAAGKEDQGFLGRGGVTVNEAERSALDEIDEVLGRA